MAFISAQEALADLKILRDLSYVRTTRLEPSQLVAYDGWGNLSGKAGLGANFTLYADPMTNRLAEGGLCYDANGNLISTGQQCAAEYG